MKTLIITLVSIAPSVAAQFSLKAGMSSEGVREVLTHRYSLRTPFSVPMDKYVLGGFLLYGLGAVVWLGCYPNGM